MAYPENPLRPAEPPPAGPEADVLLGYLERQRATFAWKVGGLTDEQLRISRPPSPLTLGGMIKHLTRFEDDMATEWLNGEPQLSPWNAIDWETEHDWDWRSAANDGEADLYAGWEAAVIRSRARFEEALADGGPDRHANRETPSYRYIVLNMIEEYARHNGQADLIRESIDGLVGQDPPSAD
jgi:hypothetical protein